MKSLMKAKKVGRFYDGGEVEAMGSGDLPSTSSESRDSPAAEPSSFKEAFASARKGGAKSFEYKGKKYTTEMAAPRSSAPVAGRPRGESVPSTDGTAPKRKALSTAGVDSKTLLPKKYASGGRVTARQTTKSHGKAC